MYEKQKGWNKLLTLRAKCFWLENDYTAYEATLRKKPSEISYRFMNESLHDSEGTVSLSKVVEPESQKM